MTWRRVFRSPQVSADNELRDALGQVNALAKQIADINSGISSVGVDNAQDLLDQQQQALSALSQLADISVTQDNDGTIGVSIGNGRALVVGANSYDLSAVSSPPNGFAQVWSAGASVSTDVTSEITGGRIAGLLQVRDTLVPQYRTSLDNLAYGVVSDVNNLTTERLRSQRQRRHELLRAAGSAAGAAQSMAVNGTVAADTSLVVASATTAAGNNDVARAIAALQDSPITGTSSTPVDAWGNLVYQVATDTKTATDSQKSPRPGDPAADKSARSNLRRVDRRGGSDAAQVPAVVRSQRQVLSGHRPDARPC